MRGISLILAFFTMFGCTREWRSNDAVTPITYTAELHRSANSLGRLRHLALMPFSIEFGKDTFSSHNDEEAAAENLQAACTDFLTKKKGYEITLVRNLEELQRDGILNDPKDDRSGDLYRKWRREAGAALTAAVIQKIGRKLNVDGVLVIHIKESRPWGIVDALLNLALLNIPLFYMISTTNSGAWIYETTSGRLVWSYEYREDKASADSLMKLFTEIDNAVPRQLIK